MFNKSKKQIYFLLNDFERTHDFPTSANNLKTKYKLDNYTLGFRIHECVANNFINGIHSKSSLANTYSSVFSQHIFLTYNGYEFLKNYYAPLKRILRDLLLIVLTALITVIINNHLSNQSNCVANINTCVSQQNK